MIKFKGSEIDTSSGICRGIMSALASDKKMTMKDIIQQYNLTAPEKLSQQNLSAKLKRDSMYFNELVGIAESIGYDLILVPHGGKEEIEVEEERVIPSKKKPDEPGDMPTPNIKHFESPLQEAPIIDTAGGNAETFTTRDNKRITVAKGGARRFLVPVTGIHGERYYISGINALRASKEIDEYFKEYEERGTEAPDENEIALFLMDIMGTYDVQIAIQEAD